MATTYDIEPLVMPAVPAKYARLAERYYHAERVYVLVHVNGETEHTATAERRYEALHSIYDRMTKTAQKALERAYKARHGYTSQAAL